jgi:UDP-2-acetamido-3-amino-2,3-dideoxy-glucuronate N-acetyltransferase
MAIATPAETHSELARRALLAGKDVLVEKPLSLSIEEGRKLVALACERQRVLMIGHLLWYHPAVLKLRELVEEGELGRIQYIYSHRLNLGRIRREENILWSFAPHDISVILGLVGEMPDVIQAQGGNYLHNQIADVTVSLLSFPSGIKAHIFVSWLHPYKELICCVLAEQRCTSSRQGRLLLGEQIAKDIFYSLPELETLVRIEDHSLHECLGLLTTRFPNGFDGQATLCR